MRRFGALITLAIALPALQGCGGDCAKLKNERDNAIEDRNPFAKLPTDDTSHIGITFKDSFLDGVVNKVLSTSLEGAMKIGTGIKISSSQSIKVSTQPDIANVVIRADAACDHCVRVMSSVKGKVSVNVPIIGNQTVPLDGDLILVAPLVFAKGQSKDAAVQIDVAEASKIGKSKMETNLKQLPPTWSNALKSPLANKMLDAVVNNIKPVTIFEFDAPDFDIEGLKVRPTKIVTDAKKKTIFVGLATNLAGVQQGDGLQPMTTLASDRNLAFGVHPAVLTSATSALMKSNKISRTYDKDGNEAAGPMSVMVTAIKANTMKDKALPITTSFRLWNLPGSGQCYWVDVDANAAMSVNEGKLRFDVSGFEVTDSSLSGIVVKLATWVNSAFWKSQKRVIEKGVSEDGLKLPAGLSLTSQPKDVTVEGNGLWISSHSVTK